MNDCAFIDSALSLNTCHCIVGFYHATTICNGNLRNTCFVTINTLDLTHLDVFKKIKLCGKSQLPVRNSERVPKSIIKRLFR